MWWDGGTLSVPAVGRSADWRRRARPRPRERHPHSLSHGVVRVARARA